MAGIFLTVLNMSIAASIVIVMVIFLRLLLKKMPAIFSYCLWLAVFVRLFIPCVFRFFRSCVFHIRLLRLCLPALFFELIIFCYHPIDQIRFF